MMNRATILQIEDEEIILRASRKLLERRGYIVLSAKTGKEGMKIATTFTGEIDLALLDVGLPDVEIQEIYPFLMKARPNLKVILCSGSPVEGHAEKILQNGAQSYIQKPFNIKFLSSKLEEVIG